VTPAGALARYWHTLRWLKPTQFFGRAYRMLRRPRIDPRPAPASAQALGSWPTGRRSASMLGPSRFRFLSEEGQVLSSAGWNDPERPKLWLYNLHYFDDLDSVDAPARHDWHRELVERWILENPPGRGNGWEPYPLSLRIVNWIKWALRTGDMSPVARHSLAIQVRYLSGDLEYHLLGNHLWANAKALVFAGLFFTGREAEGWLRRGTRLIQRQLQEQVLPDGGHFERSPMYHSIVLEDLLDLIQLDRLNPGRLDKAPLGQIQHSVGPMLRWLQIMSHPDGQIALFNDAAFDIATNPSALDDYARSLSIALPAQRPVAPLEVLADSGYIRVTQGQCVAILDVGAIGPDYLPGHAHADTLSFELSLAGERVLVDTGTSTYQPGPERQRQRSTKAHNTVSIDGLDSSEVWGGFRVARRARVHNLSYSDDGGVVVVEASHDGYQRLPNQIRHHRRWRFSPGRIEIRDWLSGGPASAQAHWHLGATTQSLVMRNQDARLQTSGLVPVTLTFSSTPVSAADDSWHPRFGVSIPKMRLDVALVGNELTTEVLWHEDSVSE